MRRLSAIAALALTGCSAAPCYECRPTPTKTELCAIHGRDRAWIERTGAPANVTTERALAEIDAAAHRAGCSR